MSGGRAIGFGICKKFFGKSCFKTRGWVSKNKKSVLISEKHFEA
jgi:hypothetical protein